ncbi:MAG TPA: FAD binding domain-containing protein [Trebonia sp.]|nr:FAD binding domain-containing protein [Trebonia sp.]
MIPPFELRRPQTLAEALALVAGGGTAYCGGTELIAAMKLGIMRPEVLVDLKPLPGLRGITRRDGRVRIGGCTTHREVAGSPVIARHAAALAIATSQLGNLRVRATGSLGGNLCFAEPRSDVAAALAALGASVELTSASGQREELVEDFLAGPFTTTRHDDELLTAIFVPATAGRSHYLRFQPGEYPTATVGLLAGPQVRVAVGAVGGQAQVFRFDRLDDVSPGQIAARADILPDRQGGEDYKRHLVAVLTGRALDEARSALDEGGHAGA